LSSSLPPKRANAACYLTTHTPTKSVPGLQVFQRLSKQCYGYAHPRLLPIVTYLNREWSNNEWAFKDARSEKNDECLLEFAVRVIIMQVINSMVGVMSLRFREVPQLAVGQGVLEVCAHRLAQECLLADGACVSMGAQDDDVAIILGLQVLQEERPRKCHGSRSPKVVLWLLCSLLNPSKSFSTMVARLCFSAKVARSAWSQAACTQEHPRMSRWLCQNHFCPGTSYCTYHSVWQRQLFIPMYNRCNLQMVDCTSRANNQPGIHWPPSNLHRAAPTTTA